MSRLRLVFMGTPAFAVPALEALLAAGHEIAAAYCQPPRPANRGQKLAASPVQVAAHAAGLAVRCPASLREEAEQAAFAALEADAAVVVAYGLILPLPVLDAPRLGCINAHASLLPRWRGAAPVQRALLAGDAETGITIMRMDEGLDTGPILLEQALAIAPDMTAQALHDALAGAAGPLLVRALDGHAEGSLIAQPQSAEGASYAAKIEKSDGAIEWSAPAVTILRQVRALNPWPGVNFTQQGERLRLLAAEPATGRAGAAAGEALDDALTIACGADGSEAVRLVRLQRAGRKAQATDAFLRGYAIAPGARLENG
jgi:methionyl-tRNA formyltransferase